MINDDESKKKGFMSNMKMTKQVNFIVRERLRR